MNSGKFPTTKYVQKEVGGSYYVLKKILQELQYESKMSSISTSKEALKETEINKKNEPPTGFKDVSSSQIPVEADTSEAIQTTDKTLMENGEAIGHKASSSPKKIGIEISDGDQKGNEAPVGKEIARENVLIETEVPTIGPTMSDIEVHSSGASRVITSGGTEAAKKNELSTEVPLTYCIYFTSRCVLLNYLLFVAVHGNLVNFRALIIGKSYSISYLISLIFLLVVVIRWLLLY